ncbi:unnamed protein product [Ectocarpus sp. 13 AM-2016]
MLSVVSLAHTSKLVPYAIMKTALGIGNIRRLEDVIFDTMYAGLLQGKLDQRQAVLKVKYAMARDVRVDDLTTMIDKLGSWASTTQVLLETLEVINSWFRDYDVVRVVAAKALDFDVTSSGKHLVRHRLRSSRRLL